MYEEMSVYLEKLRNQKDLQRKMLEQQKENTLTQEEVDFLREEIKRHRNEFSGYIGQVGSLLEISQEEYFVKMNKLGLFGAMRPGEGPKFFDRKMTDIGLRTPPI